MCLFKNFLAPPDIFAYNGLAGLASRLPKYPYIESDPSVAESKAEIQKKLDSVTVTISVSKAKMIPLPSHLAHLYYDAASHNISVERPSSRVTINNVRRLGKDQIIWEKLDNEVRPLTVHVADYGTNNLMCFKNDPLVASKLVGFSHSELDDVFLYTRKLEAYQVLERELVKSLKLASFSVSVEKLIDKMSNGRD